MPEKTDFHGHELVVVVLVVLVLKEGDVPYPP